MRGSTASTPRRRRRRPAWWRCITGADMAADSIGGLPCGWQIHNKDGSPMAEPPHPVLASGKVRHVGDPVAVVIAETKQAGEGRRRADRHRLCRTCRRSRSLRDAIAPGAPLVHDDAPGNICYDWHIGDKAVVDAAFAKAAKVVKLDLTNNRLIPNAMEPRAAIGDFDAHQRRLHALHHQPEPARDPAADGRVRAAHPGEQAARGGARRRRRLRLARSTTTPRRRSSPGRRASCGGR